MKITTLAEGCRWGFAVSSPKHLHVSSNVPAVPHAPGARRTSRNAVSPCSCDGDRTQGPTVPLSDSSSVLHPLSSNCERCSSHSHSATAVPVPQGQAGPGGHVASYGNADARSSLPHVCGDRQCTTSFSSDVFVAAQNGTVRHEECLPLTPTRAPRVHTTRMAWHVKSCTSTASCLEKDLAVALCVMICQISVQDDETSGGRSRLAIPA